MTSKIHINIEADTSAEARDQMARLLGYDGDFMTDDVDTTVDQMFDFAKTEKRAPELRDAEGKTQLDAIVDGAEAASAASTPARERGKPSPGHKRRTNAEIAEDEAAEKASANIAHDIMTEAANATPAISTGEERVGPEDTVEDQQQDAADEAAETAGDRAAGEGKLTLDDVRNVLGLYVKGYGLPAAQEDGPKLIAEVCGEGKVKVSDVPDDKIAEVIAVVKAAGKANRFERTAVAS